MLNPKTKKTKLSIMRMQEGTCKGIIEVVKRRVSGRISVSEEMAWWWERTTLWKYDSKTTDLKTVWQQNCSTNEIPVGRAARWWKGVATRFHQRTTDPLVHRLQEEEWVVLYFLNMVVKSFHCHKAQTSIKEPD
jgi:hypothetical protein